MALAASLSGRLITAVDEARRTLDLETQGLMALRAALDGPLGERVELACAAIRLVGQSHGRVIVTGMGKSGHVGRKIAATLASTGTPAHFVHPGEASHGDLGMISAADLVLALSWSGEAPELADIIAYTRRFRVQLVGITSRADSALGSASDITLCLPSMPEACPNGLAPTTSSLMQMAIGDALAVALLAMQGFTAGQFRQFHPGGKLGARLKKVSNLMHREAELPLVSGGVSLSQAIVEMTAKRFGITGVLNENDELIGVVTDGDLRRAFSNGFVDQPITSAMTVAPLHIGPDTLVDEALHLMNQAKITSIFIVVDRRPTGILHIHDLLRAGVA
ncbi:KpsF/GutQ family sugar-phosphate isomerase [Bosea sp. NPDC055353]